MVYSKILLALVCFVLTWTNVSGQHEVHHETKKERGIYELITSGIYAYSFKHEEGVAGNRSSFYLLV